MLLGVGVDLLHLPRLRRVVGRYGLNRIAGKVMNELERTELHDLREEQAFSRLALRSALQ